MQAMVQAAVAATMGSHSSSSRTVEHCYDSKAFSKVEKFSGIKHDWKSFEPVFRSSMDVAKSSILNLRTLAEVSKEEDVSNVSLN